MAREFAKFKISVWSDPGWTSLTLEQQGFYMMLASQSTINLAGVLDFLPGRLARFADGLTAKKVRSLVEALEAANMVFLDEETDELLVRALLRTSGAWKAPNSAQAIAANVEQTMSPKLQSVLMYEIQRTLDEAADVDKWAKSKETLSRVIACLEKGGINPWAKGCGNPWPNPYANPCANPSSKGLPGEGEGEGKGNGDGEPRNAAKSDYPDQFENFWQTYPKKADKRTALNAWKKALTRATAKDILDGATKYRDDPNRDPAFTKNASTWLNADAWENEPLPERWQPKTFAQQTTDNNNQALLRAVQGGGDLWSTPEEQETLRSGGRWQLGS